MSSLITKYYKKAAGKSAFYVSLQYAVFMLLFFVFYVYLLKRNPDFFLTDDGYYACGKAFYEGRIGFLNQSRGPALYLIFSAINFFPDSLHPLLRVLLTIAVMTGNIFIASKIFSKMLDKKQLFWGLMISVFNPLTIHFTIKNTPEVYLVLIMGLIILFYRKFNETVRYKYLFYSALSILAGMVFKPVFFLIPFFMLMHNIFIIKRRKSYPAILLVITVSMASYFMFQSFTKINYETTYSYGFRDILSRVYLFDAMSMTGEINLGAHEEMLKTGSQKSNYILCDELLENWLKEYKEANPDKQETAIALDFTLDHFGKSILLRATSPVLFISLTSNTAETVIYLILHTALIILSVNCIRKIYAKFRNEISGIIYVLLGYTAVFILTLSYARYSIPFLFYFLVFTGIFFSKVINRFSTEKGN